MSEATPSLANRNALNQLAALHGVQTAYRSMALRQVHCTPESVLATLRALGVDIERMEDSRSCLQRELSARARQRLEPIIVAWDGRCPSISLRVTENSARAPARWSLQLDGGECLRGSVDPHRFMHSPDRTADRAALVRCSLRIRQRLPMGYHELTVETSTEKAEARILSAPVRTYAPEAAAQSWGLFAPLYALRSARNYGTGDYQDLGSFAAWIGKRGGGVAATLPLLPLFLVKPFEPSPYSPVSRLFWSEFHLSLDDVPELKEGLGGTDRNGSRIQDQIRRLRNQPLVDYRGIHTLQRDVLSPCAHRFFRSASPRRVAFDQFRRQHPHLDSYAAFRALQEGSRSDWRHWPAPLRHGELSGQEPDAGTRDYYLYVQWLAHQQMRRAANTARQHGVELYLDLPLGVHPVGYDAWRFQSVFARDATGGAPPDPVFTGGQDWGFAPLHPAALRASGYRYLVDCLRHHLEYARILRFDHVMALHRLYWIPTGLPASAGAYVKCPAEELYAVLSIESHRHQARIVGENLGTVPAEVNRSLRRHGVRGMHVIQYELRPNPRLPLPRVSRATVASLNTHDMPPFAAYWHGLDILDRFELGLLSPTGVRSEERRRQRIRQSLQGWLRHRLRKPVENQRTHEIMLALLELLQESKAEVVLLNLEDVWLETRPQNVPGTSSERVNWQRKVRFPIETWDHLSAMRDTLQIFHHAQLANASCSPPPSEGHSKPGAAAHNLRSPSVSLRNSKL
jgi:4-alpha-glucanotransferase